MNYTRRQILRAIALGGGLVAGELWVPGARKIFLPPKTTYNDKVCYLECWHRSSDGTFIKTLNCESGGIIYSGHYKTCPFTMPSGATYVSQEIWLPKTEWGQLLYPKDLQQTKGKVGLG